MTANRQAIHEAAEKLCNWGRWGGDDQPWHWVVIPALGISMGEIFHLMELAEDCAADKVYEFSFVAPPLHLPGGAGSPINPQAIK